MKKLALTFLAVAAAALQSFAADEAGFKPLFNGKDLSGWHLRNDKNPSSWKVADGVLKNDLQKGQHGVDLVTDQKFSNFTVRYEYMVPEGSNSGFYLRGRHEIQILGQKEPKPLKNGDTSIYNFKAPDTYASKQPGEWNTVEATMIGNKITVVVNGQKVHDNVECNVATGSELDRNVNEPGSLFIQGDHGAVSLRNIQIKELAKE
jgi:hypothetical protein